MAVARLAPNAWLKKWTHAEVEAGADIVVKRGTRLWFVGLNMDSGIHVNSQVLPSWRPRHQKSTSQLPTILQLGTSSSCAS